MNKDWTYSGRRFAIGREKIKEIEKYLDFIGWSFYSVEVKKIQKWWRPNECTFFVKVSNEKELARKLFDEVIKEVEKYIKGEN